MADASVEALELISPLSEASSVTHAIELFERGIRLFNFKLYRTDSLVNPKRVPLRNYSTERSITAQRDYLRKRLKTDIRA
jgi:hypothetical protein